MIFSHLCDYFGKINKIDCGFHVLVIIITNEKYAQKFYLGKEDLKKWLMSPVMCINPSQGNIFLTLQYL